MSEYIKYNCNWSTCSFSSDNKRAAIKHIICHHAELDRVPFACTLCGFRGLFQNHLIKHVKTYKPHLLLKQKEATHGDEEYFSLASVPYNVTWGYSQDTDLQIYTEKEEIVEEINIVELTGQREEMAICSEMHNQETQTECSDLQTIQNLREELEILKAKYVKDQNNFGNYVQRLEGRLKRRVDDIDNLQKELKNRDPYIQGFD